MSEQSYRIAMRTPLGLRHGSLHCRIADQDLNGTISLMGHTQPFHGSIDPNGSCQIEGELITLMRSISYYGNGEIHAGTLHLLIHDKRRAYDIDGVRCGPEETI